jgi:hypothetical protein
MHPTLLSRPGIGLKKWLCDILRIEALYGKIAARLTRRVLGFKSCSA